MTRRSPGRRSVLLLAAVVVAAGLVALAVGLRAQVSAPQPHDEGRIHPSQTGRGTQSSTDHRSRSTPPSAASTPLLGPSPPTRVRIPALHIDTPVFPIGLNSDGTLGVPQPGPHLDQAAWFENSPTPGQLGPSIVEGHVDTVEGPSVFFRLGAIKPGDRVVIDRRDGVRVTFRVDAVRDFLKTAFPTRLVYGGAHGDLGRATLRLITCSDYDPTIRHHVGNEVVFAHLVHTSR